MTADAGRLIIERPYPSVRRSAALAGFMEHREKLQPFEQLVLVVRIGAGVDQRVEILQLQPVRHKRADDAELAARNSSRRLIQLVGAGHRDVEDARS